MFNSDSMLCTEYSVCSVCVQSVLCVFSLFRVFVYSECAVCVQSVQYVFRVFSVCSLFRVCSVRLECAVCSVLYSVRRCAWVRMAIIVGIGFK